MQVEEGHLLSAPIDERRHESRFDADQIVSRLRIHAGSTPITSARPSAGGQHTRWRNYAAEQGGRLAPSRNSASSVRMSVRPANEGDLDQIVSFTSAYRERLAGWAPVWWRRSSAADQTHPGWLAHMLRSPQFTFRVVEVDGGVEGCAVSVPQRSQWFVDDVAMIDDNRWPSSGVALLTAVGERPALTCVPSADSARLEASHAAGLDRVSSYWIGSPRDGPVASHPLGDRSVPPPPRHTFGGGLDPSVDGVLCFSDGDGAVVGSPPFPAPPIYDPGGTVCVIDRIVVEPSASARQRIGGGLPTR